MKNIFLTVCCLMTFMAATAQYMQGRESKHELSIYGLGGYSPVNLALDRGGSKSGSMGGGAGLGYTFNINSFLGIVTGVEMAVYGTEVSFDDISGKYPVGANEWQMEFSYSLNNYKEKQSITVFSIPVMAQYSLPLGSGSTKFYASGGFKLGFPLSAKTDIMPGTAKTSGYYAHENITYENLPQHGFVTDLVLQNVKQDLKPGFSAALALEAGARFSLTDKINLYTGVYLDCGLNSVQKANDKHLLEYDSFNETTFKHNSVLDTGLVSKANLLSAGLKLRIGFKLKN
ncbi:MAG: PorT family protein [Prevotellaceae bacterium]|jgi:hypothetical protein|nr:PorT family protein [Prevotellaceae bacterium]